MITKKKVPFHQSEKTEVSGGESEDHHFPPNVTKVFQDADKTEREATKLSLLLAWLLQTWLVNILLSPFLLYIRIINGLLLLFSLSSLDDCLRKSLESFINFFLGFGQKRNFPWLGKNEGKTCVRDITRGLPQVPLRV